MALTKLNSASVIERLPVGSIIKIDKVKSSTVTTTSDANFTDANGLTLSFTPRLASSTLKITADVQFKHQMTSSNLSGGTFVIVHDGTIIDNTPETYEIYDQSSGGGATESNHYMRATKTTFISASNTNARTIKVQIRRFGTSDASINWGNAFTSHLIVEEIKQ